MDIPFICAITKVNDSNLFDNILTVLNCGIKWIQYRQKMKPRKTLYEEAVVIREITHKFGAMLTVNDYIDIAMAVKSDFVHLGQDDMPLSEVKKILPKGMGIGISTHNLDEVSSAIQGGADYIGYGPLFETKTKDAGLPKGIDALKMVCEISKIPVVAIGGINKSNICDLMEVKGLGGVAISSGIFDGDIQENVKNINSIILKNKEVMI